MGEVKGHCLPGCSTVGVHGRRRSSQSKGEVPAAVISTIGKKGGETINTRQWKQYKWNTRQYVELEVNYRGDSRCGRNGIHPAILSGPGDYRTRCPEGGGIMPEVLWTSDTHVGGVSGLAGLFRTNFVFRINSSRYFSSTGQVIGQTVRRGAVRCSVC